MSELQISLRGFCVQADSTFIPSQSLQPITETAPLKNIVSQICPRFVQRYQRHRAVGSFFNPVEQVQEDWDHGFVVELELPRVFRLPKVRNPTPEVKTSSSASSSWPNGPDRGVELERLTNILGSPGRWR